MRTTSPRSDTKILPSPTRPVCAAAMIASTTRSTMSDVTGHAKMRERITDLVELHRLDDCGDEFHVTSPMASFGRTMLGKPTRCLQFMRYAPRKKMNQHGQDDQDQYGRQHHATDDDHGQWLLHL
jgi:hypothetical protein